MALSLTNVSKTGINVNNLTISVLRLFQYELIGKWMAGNQCRMSAF